VTLPVICGGMVVLTAALSLGVLSTSSLALIMMLCATTAARSVLWTVSYPLAATAAEPARGRPRSRPGGRSGWPRRPDGRPLGSCP
jgi:hypothetical protein